MRGRSGWTRGWLGINFCAFAEVVELVDALRSGRSGRKPVRVRVPPSALSGNALSVLSVRSVLSALSVPLNPNR